MPTFNTTTHRVVADTKPTCTKGSSWAFAVTVLACIACGMVIAWMYPNL